MDKEEFKKRKDKNKWRRGSFGQIKKAEDFWDKQERALAEEEGGEKGGEEEEFDLEKMNEALMRMGEDMKIALEDSPTKEKKQNGKAAGEEGRIGEFCWRDEILTLSLYRRVRKEIVTR